MKMEDLLKSGNEFDRYVLGRFFYKIHRPFLSDKYYEKLERYLREKYKDSKDDYIRKYLDTTYDEDEYPEELLKKYGMVLKDSVLAEMNAPKLYDNPNYESIKSKINDYRTHSVRPVESYLEAWEWFRDKLDKDIIFSLKVNGINTRSFICKEDKETEEGNKDNQGSQDKHLADKKLFNYKLLCSSTRAREGEGFDITYNLSRKFPKDIYLPEVCKGDIDNIKLVYGEAYVKTGELPKLRSKYGKWDTWKTARSTATSVLRVNIKDEDYQHLKLKVFKVTDIADTQSESLIIAKKCGFDVVPWRLIKANSIPRDYNLFSEWLRSLLALFSNISESEDIESDGVVAEIDNQTEFTLQGSHNQYNVGNIALKIDKWGSVVYKSVVKNIIVKGQRNKFSVKAEIEPVFLSNGNVASMVNCFNLDILIREGIKVGSEINFEYKSDANINLIRSNSLYESN